MRLQWKAKISFIYFFLRVCGADVNSDFICNTSHIGNRMIYNILNPSHLLNQMGTECNYWWNNGDTVIATSVENNKSTEVMKAGFDFLETSECLGNISWTFECWSEKIFHSSNCSTPCHNKDLLHRDNPNHKDKDGEYNQRWGVWFALILVVLLILIMVLCCKKGSIQRGLSSCRPKSLCSAAPGSSIV